MRLPTLTPTVLAMLLTFTASPAIADAVYRQDLNMRIPLGAAASPSRTVVSVTTEREDGECFIHQEGERHRTREVTTWSDDTIEEGPWSEWVTTCQDPWTMDMSPDTAAQVSRMVDFERALKDFPEIATSGLVNAIAAAGRLPVGWSTTSNNNEVSLGDGSRFLVGSFNASIVGIRTYSQPSELCAIRVMHRADGTGVNGLNTQGGQVDGVWSNAQGDHPINSPGQVTDKARAQYLCGSGGRHETYVYVSRMP